ncbi:unnamed protein product [Anisakis simplex]|uniref:Pseudouridylate synthase RPUSD4, mitochondrial n=1 Tax=Anisakis simplex TaxID=6269 RepID=A0A0M3K641_ANISI|nr:unnamed protein product [Anisakis simplex]
MDKRYRAKCGYGRVEISEIMRYGEPLKDGRDWQKKPVEHKLRDEKLRQMMSMNSEKDDDDFFGIEYVSSSPIPRHLSDKSNVKAANQQKVSGIDFIDSQYFGELASSEDSSQPQQSISVDSSNIIDEQYFKYTPSGSSTTEHPPATKNMQNIAHSQEKATVMDYEDMDYISQQLITGYQPKQSVSGRHSRHRSNELAEQSDESRSPSSRENASQKVEKQPRASKNVAPRVIISECRQIEFTGFQPKMSLEEDRSGLDKILCMLDPVWKMNDQQLVELMCERVVYEDEELLAFDKPSQMAYSGAKKNQAQLDRLLQDLKASIAPNVERLHLIRSLDKDLSGVILFAKNESVQKKIVEQYKEGLVEQRYRAIVRGVPEEAEATINIPLVKRLNQQDFYVRPYRTGKGKIQPLIALTDYRVMQDNGECSSIECIVRNDVPHQIRSHLGYGLKCPIIGDCKYSGKKHSEPPKLPARTMQRLQITGNQYRRLPMYLHLSEVSIPLHANGSRTINIRAALPNFFLHTLRKLRLIKLK